MNVTCIVQESNLQGCLGLAMEKKKENRSVFRVVIISEATSFGIEKTIEKTHVVIL